MLHLSTSLLAVISGVLIPLATAALAKDKAAAWVNNALSAVLSIVAGTASAAAGNGVIAWKPALGSILLTAATVVVTHYLPGAVVTVKARTAKFGLG